MFSLHSTEKRVEPFSEVMAEIHNCYVIVIYEGPDLAYEVPCFSLNVLFRYFLSQRVTLRAAGDTPYRLF